ncbi:hypothetical protein HY375_00495 [Candidatus Berkelbacteria bacterium]|nr:hypothetical protein [Candidatus Berkelbacteria bacterium]
MLPPILERALEHGVSAHALILIGSPAAQTAAMGELKVLLKTAPADTYHLCETPTMVELRTVLARVHYRPVQSARVLVAIEGTDRWSVELGNVLLKTLEEPPAYVCLALGTTAASTLLPTIRSRAASYRLVGDEPGDERPTPAIPALRELAALPLHTSLATTKQLASTESVTTVLDTWIQGEPSARGLLLPWRVALGDRPVNARLMLEAVLLEYRATFR